MINLMDRRTVTTGVLVTGERVLITRLKETTRRRRDFQSISHFMVVMNEGLDETSNKQILSKAEHFE
jgi:hypothetical protein